MFLKILIYFIVLSSGIGVYSQELKESELLTEDGRLRFSGLAKKYGHPATENKVTTDDGYILTVYRQQGNTKRPVLLIHGNTPTCDCWIIRGNTSMAITLAELGYDVWTINLRGTEYSRSHIKLDPDRDSAKFFDYSFYEQAIYDLPATIDFILEGTGQKQLSVIAHSVGTTLLNVLGAERPDYNEKISIAILLSPIVFLAHVKGTAGLVLPIAKEITKVLSIFNINELLTIDFTGALLRFFCLKVIGSPLCLEIILFPLCGYDRDGFEPDFLPTQLGHFPGGTTRKIFEHLGQVAERNKFGKFDYGALRNIKEYGSVVPPEFDLRKVTMKTAIFVGKEDYLGTVKDVERLNQSLPNVVHYQVLPYEKFNHADFVWGSHMQDNLYPYVIDVLQKYT